MKWNNFWVVAEWNTNVVMLERRHARIVVDGYASEKVYEHLAKGRAPWRMPDEISRHHNYAEARAVQKLLRASRGYK